MNTRLQVEHPVTEMVTGVDLVHCQIRTARGERLTVDRRHALTPQGHAIEARSTPRTPTPGRITFLRTPSGPGVRDDSGVEAGFTVPVHYDSMISKVVAWAPDRAGAIARLRRALGEYEIGGITTAIPAPLWILEQDAFAAGDFDTAYLDRVLGKRRGRSFSELPDDDVDVAVAAAVLLGTCPARTGPRAANRRGRRRGAGRPGWRGCGDDREGPRSHAPRGRRGRPAAARHRRAAGDRRRRDPAGATLGTLDGVLLGDLTSPRVEATFAGEDVRAWNVDWGRGRGEFVVEDSYLDVIGGDFRRDDSAMEIDGQFSMSWPRPDGGEEMNALVRLESFPAASIRAAFGLTEGYLIDGPATGEMRLYGAYRRLFGVGRLRLDRPTAYGEPSVSRRETADEGGSAPPMRPARRTAIHPGRRAERRRRRPARAVASRR